MEPFISIIIPFTNTNTINACVESVLGCDFPRERYEVILVGPKAQSVADKYQVQAVVTDKVYPPGKMRNLGALKYNKLTSGQARSEILIFLDDDTTVVPDWLSRNKEALCSVLGNGGRGGPPYADRDVSGPLVVGAQIIDASSTYWGQAVGWANFSLCRLPYPVQRVVTSTSLAVSRAVFEAVGGFDQELMVKEDTDFCYRVVNWQVNSPGKIPFPILYQPTIKVYHHHSRQSFGSFLTYMYRNGRVSGLVVERRYQHLGYGEKCPFVNQLLGMLDSPIPFLLAIIPWSLASTLYTLALNVKYHPQVLLYSPAILLGKLATQAGVWVWLLSNSYDSNTPLE